MNEVKKYIENNWDSCIKAHTEDKGDLIGLPYPYIVPAVGHFDEMYYWDTYFTNKGLILSDRAEQVKNNTDNMLYIVEKYGYMLNGTSKHFIGRSQPPFLSLMVRDTYEAFGDKKWLVNAYETLKKEYNFWMTERITPIGLNRYLSYSAEGLEAAATAFIKRVGFEPKSDTDTLGQHTFCSYESGWDITPRWGFECQNYAPVDLNSLMYGFEKNMSFFSEEIGVNEENLWNERAEKRKSLMTEYMLTEDNIFMDYNFEKKELSEVFSIASYYPMFAELANEKQKEALKASLHKIEYDYGISSCEKNSVKGSYQWNYPNGWACLQYIMYRGFNNYGEKEIAVRIAEKYVKMIEKTFKETGNLWEKYNVVEGNINVTNEYQMPPMMGWSAGIYLDALDFLGR